MGKKPNGGAMQAGEATELAVLKNQMQTVSTDIAELKKSVGTIGEQMNAMLLSFERAKGTFVSTEAHNQALQAVRTEMTNQLDKHTKEHTQQLADLQAEVKELSKAYLKMVGAGIVLTFIATQLKTIISFFQ